MPAETHVLATHRLRVRLENLYGMERGSLAMHRLEMLIGRYGMKAQTQPPPQHFWDEQDTVLITYGDMVSADEGTPLRALDGFLQEYLREALSTVHILPFFPYSSDDGFSVIDYRQVNEAVGKWADIRQIASHFKLAADLVLNHCSRKSEWFVDFSKGVSPDRDYFMTAEPEDDLSDVVRPRVSPLLHEVTTIRGTRHVWTTFSSDQIDLDFRNPDVLFEFLDIMLYYLSQGVRIFRLDAIAYLWKEIGTSCIHLPQTHEVVKIFRDLLEIVAPDAVLLTETNVPHEENISYFGDGDEAHMVYQFALPPLLLHALQTGNSRYLTRWARNLGDPPEGCTFLNFTASHDGVGVRPLEGIVPRKHVNRMVERVRKLGGLVGSKRNKNGTETPYELNITYFDALGDPDNPKDLETTVRRFICSQTVMLAFRGVPAVYFNSLIGAQNWQEGYQQTQHPRTLNRQKWQLKDLEKFVHDTDDHRSRVFREYIRRLALRRQQPAFHPAGEQRVLNLGQNMLGFVREAPDLSQRIACIFNFTAEPHQVARTRLPAFLRRDKEFVDILSGEVFEHDTKVTLSPYGAMWLVSTGERVPESEEAQAGNAES